MAERLVSFLSRPPEQATRAQRIAGVVLLIGLFLLAGIVPR
jgi:hypothetical protein